MKVNTTSSLPTSSPLLADDIYYDYYNDYYYYDYKDCNQHQACIDAVYRIIQEHIKLNFVGWMYIIFSVIVFIVGTVGNFVVCFTYFKSKVIKKATDMYIFNLAVADFFVILLCLPPTTVHDLTNSWFLGEFVCKLVVYLQVQCFFINIHFNCRLLEGIVLRTVWSWSALFVI